jgi:hypothetical protein
MIEVSAGTRGALAALQKFIDGLSPALERGLSQTAFRGQKVAVSRSNGSVAAGVGVSATPDGYELQARAPHSVFVERGRGEVHAAPGKYLRFEVGGRVVFARKVRPARPRPFMAPARAAMAKSTLVVASVERLVRSL